MNTTGGDASVKERIHSTLNLNLLRTSWLIPALLAPALPYGGQAAIEGVMMKGREHAALAMRRRDGRIEILERTVKSRFPRLLVLPFVRGMFILIDMMALGMWALRESSHRYEVDLESAAAEEKGEAPKEVSSGAAAPTLAQTIAMILAFAVALFMFKLLPAIATTGIFAWLGWGLLRDIADPTLGQQFIANLIEGTIKMGIFVGYVWSIGKLKEVERVFEYHGSEHIVINAYEDDPGNQSMQFIQSHGVAHPRCGTSFIVILIVLSVFLFTLFDWALLALGAQAVDNLPVWWLRWPMRILGILPLAGISYEIIRAAFKYYGNPILRPLLRFGMLFQALTTRRPSDEQVEVSLASFNRVRYLTEGVPEPAAANVPEPTGG
ncbi:DUF1385 domain-containing protein [bacterium]|nr:DUF1385 domain-containing protein [bacterium]